MPKQRLSCCLYLAYPDYGRIPLEIARLTYVDLRKRGMSVMAKYELRVDVTYGTLVVAFDSITELEQRLKDLDVSGVSRIVETHLKSVAKAEPRKVKPVLEGICAFRPDGRLELLKPAG